ncbi:phage holin family protein [Clavibacter sp. VKM Ac-2873]|uniref:phage holin family protein n=1 Tax=Clavibacter sp. VKM Ac-2873 TaxID=2783813 RepID=UPI00188C394B|nr:phage holin family protein [Clavibacter sp. VKM Ac-2873]MBF4618530.1 phage holin family protein [Clavibacter sp. VKM Ac-2873]
MTDDDSSSRGGWLGGSFAQKAIDPLLRAVRAEIDSAKREIGERARSARSGAIMLGAGVALALVSLGLLAAVIVALLLLALPLWAATLITLALFGIATAVVVRVGLARLSRGVPPVPSDTLHHARDRMRPGDRGATGDGSDGPTGPAGSAPTPA